MLTNKYHMQITVVGHYTDGLKSLSCIVHVYVLVQSRSTCTVQCMMIFFEGRLTLYLYLYDICTELEYKYLYLYRYILYIHCTVIEFLMSREAADVCTKSGSMTPRRTRRRAKYGQCYSTSISYKEY
jgi:hypothetical protein